VPDSLSVRRSLARALSSALIVLPAVATLGRAQQSDLSIGPFLSYLPSSGASPLAGLALTIASGSIAFRGSGHLSLEDRSSLSSDNRMRPWGADADLLLMSPSRRSLSPFVFAGVGTSAADSDGFRVQQHGWSYGAGLSVPLGGALDVFGEMRYRMSSFVLPTAYEAPSPRQELRVGMSFHVGGGSSSAHRATDSRRISVIPSGEPVERVVVRPTSAAARVLPTADHYVGVKYRYGGTSPTTGFDCSGFVQYVFAQHGVRLPRTSRQQAAVGTRLSADWDAVAPGDLVMFEEGGRIGHVAIYAGRNRIIHATASGGSVRYDDLSTSRGRWFADHMVAARRVTPDPRGLLLDLARGFAAISVELDPPDRAPKP